MARRAVVTAGVACALIGFASTTWAQATVTKMLVRPIASVNGKDVYRAYCANCHGDDLTGHGPGAVGLRVPPADLTTIALRNDGKFVTSDVEHTINGWNRIPRTMGDVAARQHAIETGEGTDVLPTMPPFGPIFAKHYSQEERDRRIRMSNLISYVKSKQAKAPASGAGPQ